MSQPDKSAFATRVIHAGQSPDPTTGALMPPIYANSTYLQDSPGVHKGFDYGRSHNPTRFALERCVADLEGGSQAFAFASGLAAISTVLELLDAGAHIVSGNDLYGGTFRLFDKVRQRSAGHRFSFVDLSDVAAFEASLQDDTRMVWVETPSNPLLSLTDLSAIARICRSRGILCVADNTFASPVILFFLLGAMAAFVRSDLAIPEAAAKTIALYLMMSIGLRGGIEVAETGLAPEMALAGACGIALSLLLPLPAFALLKWFGRLDQTNAAAVAAHYGSVSVVTFAAGSEVLKAAGMAPAGFMVAVLALMETPAILTGLLLARRTGPDSLAPRGGNRQGDRRYPRAL